VIKLKDLVKEYKAEDVVTRALDGISMELKTGEYVAVMGASGSGKSTLLNILGGMDTSTSGEYYFDDLLVSDMNMTKLHEFRKENVSFVFQNFALINQYTVYENVELPLIARRIPAKRRKELVEDALKRFGIDGLKNKYPLHISGGQQQRASIARALVTGVRLLLADEPTGALDKKTGNLVMDLIDEIHTGETIIVLVTHDPEIAKRADRIIKIEDGKIVD